MDRRNIAKDLREYSLTLTGLVGLQLPCLVSAAQLSSPLAQFQSYGLLFNMSSATLKDHFSFSPENLAQGRYHTLVTNLFNHQDEQHLFNNFATLVPNGYHVHRRFGRKHLLAAFFGGGVAGNLTQFCFYIFQKIRWETVLPSPNSWGLLGDFLGNKADILQKFALDKAFTSIHGTTSCKGASAAICSIVAIETCANIVSLYDKYIELRRRRRLGIADREWDNQMTQEMMYEVCHLGLVITVLLSDLVPLLDSTTPGKGIISTFVAYSADGIGHAAHMGGFIFGVLYYLIALSGNRTPGNNR